MIELSDLFFVEGRKGHRCLLMGTGGDYLHVLQFIRFHRVNPFSRRIRPACNKHKGSQHDLCFVHFEVLLVINLLYALRRTRGNASHHTPLHLKNELVEIINPFVGITRFRFHGSVLSIRKRGSTPYLAFQLSQLETLAKLIIRFQSCKRSVVFIYSDDVIKLRKRFGG